MKHEQFIFPFDQSKGLSNFKTDFTGVYQDKEEAKDDLKDSIRQMRKEQNKMYAHDQKSLLIVFQAMDAAGKDSTIKHVMSGVNPQGCRVVNFKQPSSEELDHDYLWRCNDKLPRKGNITIFNRSYYEEVLVVRVHPSLLAYQKLPDISGEQDPGEAFWQRRFREINHFEKYLSDNHTHILKFFLYVSKDEQKQRFLDRINEPDKNWKFSMGDVKERQLWNKYMYAYEQLLLNTSKEYAPWYVIPADHKWYMRTVVGEIIAGKMANMDLSYPHLAEEDLAELQEAKKQLLNE